MYVCKIQPVRGIYFVGLFIEPAIPMYVAYYRDLMWLYLNYGMGAYRILLMPHLPQQD